MNLAPAIQCITRSFTKLNNAYGRVVFDETAIVGLAGNELQLHYYAGPRESEFMSDFAEDSISLRKELTVDQSANGGEFSFTRDGAGAGIDAYICLGPDLYLFCNNTEKSMPQVTADPAWLNAQGEFLNASQLFAVDPLLI
jgi:hypothetical protein